MVRPFNTESPLPKHRLSRTNQNDPDYYLTCACMELFLTFVRGVPNANQPRALDERSQILIPEHRTNYSPCASLVLTHLLLDPHSEIIKRTLWPLRDAADARDSPALDLDIDLPAQGAGTGARPARWIPRGVLALALASENFWKANSVPAPFGGQRRVRTWKKKSGQRDMLTER
jgi:hypothetical protein